MNGRPSTKENRMSDLNDKNVAALLRERASLVSRGLTDRVQQVDKQLASLGHSDAEPERAEAPRGRRSKSTETAD